MSPIPPNAGVPPNAGAGLVCFYKKHCVTILPPVLGRACSPAAARGGTRQEPVCVTGATGAVHDTR